MGAFQCAVSFFSFSIEGRGHWRQNNAFAFLLYNCHAKENKDDGDVTI
jgi:hypothetical protein